MSFAPILSESLTSLTKSADEKFGSYVGMVDDYFDTISGGGLLGKITVVGGRSSSSTVDPALYKAIKSKKKIEKVHYVSPKYRQPSWFVTQIEDGEVAKLSNTDDRLLSKCPSEPKKSKSYKLTENHTMFDDYANAVAIDKMDHRHGGRSNFGNSEDDVSSEDPSSDELSSDEVAIFEPDEKKWNDIIDDQTLSDATDTVTKMFGEMDIKLVNYKTFTPVEFDKLGATNHRARLNATLEEMFDQPRDLQSVEHHKTNPSSPVAILMKDNEYVVLDGVHRIVASYLLGSPIKAALFRMTSPNSHGGEIPEINFTKLGSNDNEKVPPSFTIWDAVKSQDETTDIFNISSALK